MKRYFRAFVTLLLVGFIAVLGLEAEASSTNGATTASGDFLDSGIYGQTLLWPITPVCQPRVPCSKPFSTTVIVRRPGSTTEVARFTSDRYGLFLLKLAPGRYRLMPLHPRSLPVMRPTTVNVAKHRFTRVVLFFDTGIR